MQVGQFPATAANSLIEGYCDDFVAFASVLAQTLEQIAMRGISIDRSRDHLQRIGHGMRDLSESIRDLIARSDAGPGPGMHQDAHHAEPGREASTKAPSAPFAPASVDHAPMPGMPGLHAATMLGAPTPTVLGMPKPDELAPAKGAAPAGRSAGKVGEAAALATNEEGFHGNSESMPLRSVFQFLGRTRRSGFMRVVHGEEQIMFEVQNGCLVSTTSNACMPKERLDLVLIERNASTAADLAPIIERIPATQCDRFSEAVVAAGVVTEAQIFDALATQQKRRYSRACLATSVNYQFFEGKRKRQAFRLLPPPMPIG